jgi:hypothetical protein
MPEGAASGRSLGPAVALAASCAATLAVLALLQGVVSLDALLPAVIVTFFLTACVAALLAWIDRAGSTSRGLTYWDVSGLLTLAGILLAAAVEPDQLLRLAEADPRTR